MSLKHKRRSEFASTIRNQRGWMTAATLVLTVSSVATFSASRVLHHQHATCTTQRRAVTDPDTLFRGTVYNEQWDRHVSEIESMYHRSSLDSMDDLKMFQASMVETTSITDKLAPSSSVLSSSSQLIPERIHIHHQRPTYSITQEELIRSSTSSTPTFKRVASKRRYNLNQESNNRNDATTSTVSKSSTMPGFGATSSRERAFVDGILLAESRSGKDLSYQFTEEARRKRKQSNGEAMYRTSAAVPDSMVNFANQIHMEDRISPKEELELGKLTQEAIRLQNLYDKLEVKLGREPMDEEWCAAAGKINLQAIQQTMDEGLEAKNKLVTANLRMVQRVVNTYIRNGLGGQYNAGDMMQEGIMALIRAAEKFEPHRGFRFSTYAMYWIRAAVKRSQTVQSRVIPVPQRLHANYKRVVRTEMEMKRVMGRAPTKKELSEAVDMSETQLERCLRAMDQRTFSLDQTITNTLKPNSGSDGGNTMYDLIASRTDDGEHRSLQRVFLREDLIETLNRHLTQTEVQLLMLRFGMVEQELLPPGYEGSLTIAEVSKLVGLKPDKVRRMIINSLQQMKFVIGNEWDDFETQIQ